MRWFVLILGFLVVTVLFGSTTTGMVAAAIVYVIFSQMGRSKPVRRDDAGESRSLAAEEPVVSPDQVIDPAVLSLDSTFSDSDYNYPPSELDHIALSFPSPDPVEVIAPVKRKSRVMVVAGVIAIAFLLFLALKPWFTDPSSGEVTSHPAENPLPLPHYRDQQACLDTHFPGVALAESQSTESITTNGGWRRGELTAGLYCSFDWDPTYVRDELSILRSHGLLTSQWNQAVIAEGLKQGAALGLKLPEGPDPHSAAQDPQVADFSRFLEGMAIASEEGDFPPPFPAAKARKAARAELNLDHDLVFKTNLPRRFLLKDESPAIALITDLPDSLKVKMIARDYAVSSGGLALTVQNNLEAWSGMRISKLMAPDFFTYNLVTNLKLMLQAYLQKRSETNNSPLEDLEIVFTHADLPVIGGHTITRKAFYVTGKGRIYARRTGIVSYDESFKKTAKRPFAMFEQLYPPELMHELNHYFFTNGSLSSSPFILEGEATYEGEAALRPVRAALKYSEKHSPQELVGRSDLTPEKVNNIFQRELAALGLSRNEGLNVCRAAAVFARADFSLERFLTITSERMSDLPEEFHRDFYPVAWAVYASMVGESTWHDQMIPLAERAIKGNLSPEDRETAVRFGKLGSRWVSAKLQKEAMKCNP